MIIYEIMYSRMTPRDTNRGILFAYLSPVTSRVRPGRAGQEQLATETNNFVSNEIFLSINAFTC